MATIFDVAKFILESQGTMTTWKLQKLSFYSQAFHSYWDDKHLFSPEDFPFQAWENGPVCPQLYEAHKGMFTITPQSIGGDSNNLTEKEKDSITVVLNAYGHLNGHQLSELTHSESPWKDARGDTPPMKKSRNEISLDSMTKFAEAESIKDEQSEAVI